MFIILMFVIIKPDFKEIINETIKRKFPKSRLRRTRMKSFSRKMVSENNLTANDVIWPVFLTEER